MANSDVVRTVRIGLELDTSYSSDQRYIYLSLTLLVAATYVCYRTDSNALATRRRLTRGLFRNHYPPAPYRRHVRTLGTMNEGALAPTVKTPHASRPRRRALQKHHACAARHLIHPTGRCLSPLPENSMHTSWQSKCRWARAQRVPNCEPQQQFKRQAGRALTIPARTVLNIHFSLQASSPVATCPPPTCSSRLSRLLPSSPPPQQRCPHRALSLNPSSSPS